MGWVSGIVVYLLVWWVVIFAVLPWGLQRDEAGKPENPKIKHKIITTSLISATIWLVIYCLIRLDVISFREAAELMAAGNG